MKLDQIRREHVTDEILKILIYSIFSELSITTKRDVNSSFAATVA